MRVLVAEDDLLSRLITEATVSRLGHSVLSAANGEDAWRLFQEHEVDAIVSDRSMPVMNGEELCRLVRTHPTARYPYFIFLTAHGDRALIESAMKAGADDYLVKPFDPEELEARLGVAARIAALHRKLSSQQATLELLNQQLFDQARIDPLTGLGTRLKLNEDLGHVAADIQHNSASYAALMCDVDNFKEYNDRYGHLAGDEALRKVGKALSASSRATDRLYRYGGEEFLIISEAETADRAFETAERYRAAVEQLDVPHATSGWERLTVSMGISCIQSSDPGAVPKWLQEADTALYIAKGRGRNCVARCEDAEVPAAG